MGGAGRNVSGSQLCLIPINFAAEGMLKNNERDSARSVMVWQRTPVWVCLSAPLMRFLPIVSDSFRGFAHHEHRFALLPNGS